MLLCTFVTTLAVVLATACTSNPSPGGPAAANQARQPLNSKISTR